MNPFKAVQDFHEKYNQDVNQPFTQESINLRCSLIAEEVRETFEEIINLPTGVMISEDQIDKEKVTKELSDILYVTIGSAVTWGLPLEEVFRRTHESNMTKDGGFREDGKILKGDGYVPPSLEDLFDE